VEGNAESWPLRSGMWHRDAGGRWRLAATPGGSLVHARLPEQDLGRMIGASRDLSTGQWFPSDFSYSPQTGVALQITIPSLDSPWVPPFGTASLADLARPSGRGLRQTSAPLALVRSQGQLDPASAADQTLPSLPPGEYRFLVLKFDVASPTLMAIELEQGFLLVLLPESKTWMPLEGPAGAMLAAGLKDCRAWRMEVVKAAHHVALYLPTVRGLAVVTPSVIGLSYSVDLVGMGCALGGPVAWAGEVWLPVLGDEGQVDLVGRPAGSGPASVLHTSVRAPRDGFEAPVFDAQHVIWPSEEGQLVLRLGQDGNRRQEWIAWPEGLHPAFALGCPYQSLYGFFWQLCSKGNDEFEYVEMGTLGAERVAVDAPRLSTGHVSYRNGQRIVGDPWKEPTRGAGAASSHVVVPLIESDPARAVVGLRMDAPQGILALLASGEPHRAVLQLQGEDGAEVRFGALNVTRPWRATLFVYDAHLWVYHRELPQALGWRLFN